MYSGITWILYYIPKPYLQISSKELYYEIDNGDYIEYYKKDQLDSNLIKFDIYQIINLENDKKYFLKGHIYTRNYNPCKYHCSRIL